jgi:tripartite-type tricarboxylate transporter receptor subunit TctC
MRPRRAIVAFAFGAALALGAGVCATAQAQAWPSKPVRKLVGAAAGGTTDIVARIIAAKLSVLSASGR